jgi:ribosomal protein S18 acetylase RimI-like enzyme
MSSSRVPFAVRPARTEELDACISIWVQACEDRDGRKVEGIAETARARFDAGVTWLVARSPTGLAGFVLCTRPGSDVPTDPPEASVVGMLAVAPDHQGLGVAKELMRHALTDLARQGQSQAVLHVFADNTGAVHLYESTGWQRTGDEIMIDPLGKRPSWTYSYSLTSQETSGGK